MSPDAEVRSLGSIAVFKSGGTPSKSRLDYWEGDFPWVSAKDLKSPILKDSIDHLSTAGFAVGSIAPENSLLILVRGMTLHKDVPVCLAGRDIAFNQDIKALIVSKEINPKYLLFFLHAQKNRLLDLVDSAGHGTGRLNTTSLMAFPVLIPSLPEQNAIADFFSTWDAAIEKTERLIAAKENGFKGLVQKLVLTPSQIKGHWKHSRISDISKRIQRRPNGDELPILTISSASGFVLQEEKYSRYMAGESIKNYILLRKGEFAYNKGNSLRYQFGCVFKIEAYNEALVPHVYVCFKLNPGVDSEYIDHLFHADYLKRQLGRIVKTGVRNNGLLNIKPDEFMNVTIPIPSFDQQKQIASTLNTARQEIDLLKKQAEAFRKQKRGLMQKLLTGQWRVKVA